MTNERAVELLKIEKECILRQDTSMCNRDTCGCQCCDLVQDSEEILAAYDMAISALTADPDAEAFKAGYIKGALKCSQPTSAEWVIRNYSSEFGNFKRWACDHCDNWRAQVSVAYCAFCGSKMVNPEEVEESEGTILGGTE